MRRWRKFRDRTLSALDCPYVFLDATYCKARVNHRMVSQAIAVAVGVAADWRREVLGFDVGDAKERGVLDRIPSVVEAAWA
jgi:transposase-like protein